MDTRSKIVFLKEVKARKHDLFSKGDSRVKDEVWNEVYRQCLAEGCIGLRNSEYLRRTTYQNIQRRAKEKYEKGLKDGMETINLTEVDELLLEIIGRDKLKPINENEDVFSSPDLDAILGLLNGTTNPSDMSSGLDFEGRDSTPSSDLADNRGFTHQELGGISSDSTTAASPDSDSDLGTPALQLAATPPTNFPPAIWSLLQNNKSNPVVKQNGDPRANSTGGPNGRKRSKPGDQRADEEEEAGLRRRKLRAEIRLLEAQIEAQERESQLKKLQIVALRRELGLQD